MANENSEAHHVIHYKVDDEDQETTEVQLTPNQIMSKAGVNPSDHYLVEIKGRQRVSYQDSPGTPIHMHENQKFSTVFVGVVPVS